MPKIYRHYKKEWREYKYSFYVIKIDCFDRLKVSPKLHDMVDDTDIDEDEANATMDGQLISNLVGIVSEGDLNEAMLGSLYELQASCRKSKSSSNKKPKKRVKVSKSTIVAQ
jgi:hypothetical protein